MTRERGQVAVAGVGLALLVLLGAAVLVHLGRIRAEGAHGQRAADMAAIAAANVLARDPSAPAAELRRAASTSATANAGRLVWLRLEGRPGLPTAVDVGVEIVVGGSVPGAGVRHDAVVERARAGVSYTARLPADRFRPVDLHGARGAAAVTAAAEAQIGWPYVWGGESRAEGGFDCSGLVDYAYSAAGVPLPGRPTAADLWRMSRPVAASSLAPGDLVFLGTASGDPYHVGLYVGGGTVVVAPHTGATVRYEPVTAGGWDGFGRLLPDSPGTPVLPSAAESAARRAGVPAHVVEAELALGVATEPRAAAASLAAAQARHPGDLEAALADALGGPSAAALVLRAASGPAIGDGFQGAVHLLPEPVDDPGGGTAAGLRLALPGASPAVGRLQPGAGGSLRAEAETGLDAVARGLNWLETGDGHISLGGFAGVHHLSRLVLNVLTAAPNRTLAALASVGGYAWDTVTSVVDLVGAVRSGGVVLSGPGVWAARASAVGSVLTLAAGASLLIAGRTRRQRLVGGIECAGAGLQVAGLATAGTDLIVLGAAGMEVPPLGIALIAAGTAITCGVAVYQSWPVLAASGGAAVRSAVRVGSEVRARVTGAAGAALGGARSLVSSLPTPW